MYFELTDRYSNILLSYAREYMSDEPAVDDNEEEEEEEIQADDDEDEDYEDIESLLDLDEELSEQWVKRDLAWLIRFLLSTNPLKKNFKTLSVIYIHLSNRDQTYKMFGIQLAFIATRSGLTRFSDHSHLFKDPNERRKMDPEAIPEP